MRGMYHYKQLGVRRNRCARGFGSRISPSGRNNSAEILYVALEFNILRVNAAQGWPRAEDPPVLSRIHILTAYEMTGLGKIGMFKC